jgi:dTDP-4-amino-4,6-dideoxygalactose transaminase
MDALRGLADTHSLAIIEDCAHAHGASFRNESAGSIGTFGSFSFQSSKPMTAGEGGIVIGRDKALLDKVYSQRNCGRHGAERGHPILGGNQRMTEWQAAILLGQLEQLDRRAETRERAIRRLREKLASLTGVSMLTNQPAVTKRPMYRLSFHYDERRAGIPLWAFIDAVRAEGVPIEPTYQPIYANPLWYNGLATGPSWYGRKVPHYRCPIAERIAHTSGFTLPQYIFLGTDHDVDDVAAVFHKVLTNAHEAVDMTDKAKEIVKGLSAMTR